MEEKLCYNFDDTKIYDLDEYERIISEKKRNLEIISNILKRGADEKLSDEEAQQLLKDVSNLEDSTKKDLLTILEGRQITLPRYVTIPLFKMTVKIED